MTTRFRQTFKYPSDEDGNDSEEDARDDLDEEEQEALIAKLQDQDTSNNETYARVFTFIPLACTPVFVLCFFLPGSASGSRSGVRMLCILSVTSLLASAFQMWFVPLSQHPSLHSTHRRQQQQKRPNRVRKVPGLDVELDDDGPLGRAVPWLNFGICVILALSALGLRGKASVPEGLWIMVLLPAVINGMVFVARKSMSEVESGIEGLSGLRYDYKGA